MDPVRPAYHIYSTGSELSEGRTSDGNGPLLARKFTEMGFVIRGLHVLPDDPDLILSELMNRVNEPGLSGLIISGGLGPTSDDHTLDVLARLSGRDVIDENESLRRLTIFLRKKKRSKVERSIIRRQIRTLRGALPLINEQGLAPGLVLEQDNDRGGTVRLIALPGVPREMSHMLETKLLPLIEKWHAPDNFPRLDFYLYDIPESRFEASLIDEAAASDISSALRWGVTSHRGYLKIFLEDSNRQSLLELQQRLHSRFPQRLLEECVERALQNFCVSRNVRIGLAESCTGGMIAARLTDLPGSSEYFRGGIVAYSNDLKTNLLDVSENILNESGAVSEDCARAMAAGAVKALNVDFALAVTGIAGPGGGTPDKPIGTVYAAVKGHNDSGRVFRFYLPFDRAGVREYTVNLALFRLFEYVTAG